MPPRMTRSTTRRMYPVGVRKGGDLAPELYPVQPKMPGTRDKMHRPQTTTDPEIKASTVWQIKARANRQKKSRSTTTMLGERPK